MKLKLLVTLFLISFTLVACSETSSGDKDDTPVDDGQVEDVQEPTDDPVDNGSDLLQLTLDELAEYDGQSGRDAYVAVNGVIYDVTGVSAWNSGNHNGVSAGQDVTNFINNAPHGESVLDNLDVVGELVD